MTGHKDDRGDEMEGGHCPRDSQGAGGVSLTAVFQPPDATPTRAPLRSPTISGMGGRSLLVEKLASLSRESSDDEISRGTTSGSPIEADADASGHQVRHRAQMDRF